METASDGDFHAREARLLVPPTQPPIHDIPTDRPVSGRAIANAGDEIFRRTFYMYMRSHSGRRSSKYNGARYCASPFCDGYISHSFSPFPDPGMMG